jgi:hypothetical protein
MPIEQEQESSNSPAHGGAVRDNARMTDVQTEPAGFEE